MKLIVMIISIIIKYILNLHLIQSNLPINLNENDIKNVLIASGIDEQTIANMDDKLIQEKVNSFFKETKKGYSDDEIHYFKDFKFLNKEQVQKLFSYLKQPLYKNYLSQEAQLLINSAGDINSTLRNDTKIDEYLNSVLKNSEGSLSFIDQNGVISRKGIINLIDIDENKGIFKSTKNYYGVVNSNVFVLYQLYNKNIIKLIFQIDRMIIDDIFESPCFYIKSNKNTKKYLICSLSKEDKYLWINTFNSLIKNN